ncbi:NTP transferase domain-containing protein [Lunatimonas salinarum]|uniref:NTP transferase domain-containing protein n=1 Tax=Lunatimonas salinarum TaxID=1774590 RepID=UPI0031584FCE
MLIGGKSSRMGKDKSLLCYQGTIPQREYLLSLLAPICQSTYLSCNQHQLAQISQPEAVIVDRFQESGPMGAILSAFGHRADCAWLVVACDLPMLSVTFLECLVAARNTKKQATAFRKQHARLPEPLCTIYEPSSYQTLQNEFDRGNLSPAKALLAMDVAWQELKDDDILMNVNNPQEHIEALAKIGRHLK